MNEPRTRLEDMTHDELIAHCRARLDTAKQLTAQVRTSRLMWSQNPRILNDTQPTDF